jgi:hypothetical protein
MDPHRPLQNIDVVQQDQAICGLVQQESMPRCWNVGRVIGDRHSQDELRNDNSDTCTQRNPRKNVGCTTTVALHNNQHYVHHQEVSVVTSSLLQLFGAKIQVQWYCPPAVGYTLASSARVKAQAPTSTNMMMGP